MRYIINVALNMIDNALSIRFAARRPYRARSGLTPHIFESHRHNNTMFILYATFKATLIPFVTRIALGARDEIFRCSTARSVRVAHVGGRIPQLHTSPRSMQRSGSWRACEARVRRFSQMVVVATATETVLSRAPWWPQGGVSVSTASLYTISHDMWHRA